jgi:hypothetical protein
MRMLRTPLVGLLLLLVLVPGRGRCAEAFADEEARRKWIEAFIRTEGRFHRPGVGYNEASGLTYDGHPIHEETGELTGKPRGWSAASKESLHVMLLALAIAGDERAALFVSPERPGDAAAVAVALLERKRASYCRFIEQFPGFGGFLPWFKTTDEGLTPMPGWKDRVPALDNGQWAWSLFLAADVLDQAGYAALAEQYRKLWGMLARNSVPIFCDTARKKVRMVARIDDVSASPEKGRAEGEGALEDPYEGELMVLFMTLFAARENPEWAQANPGWFDEVWKAKTKLLVRREYQTREGQSISVRQGFWYSSHEMWSFLVLPYTDDELVRRVFLNGERARTWNSAEKRIPGLFASVNSPAGENQYISAAGIPGPLARARVTRTDVVTPYAAFPVLLADEPTGLAWLDTMLSAPRMRGPYGATEAVTTDGRRIAPLLTWDAKATTVLALCRTQPAAARMGQALKRDGRYDEFLRRIHEFYRQAFGAEPLKGEDLPLRAPTGGFSQETPGFRKAERP